MKKQKFRRLLPDRERLLFLVYVLRAVPKHDLLIQFDKGDTYIRNLINSLVRTKYLRVVTLVNDYVVYYLSAKGYRYVTQKFLEADNPQYAHLTSRIRRIPIYDHHFMNFKFVWHFLNDEWDNIDWKKVRIFTDQDSVNCKVDCDHQGKTLAVRPDVLIEIGKKDSIQKDLIMVENDTGKEHYRTLFQKFLQYAVLLKTKQLNNLPYINKISLYLVCVSKSRLENIFKTDIIAKLFDYDNKLENYYMVDAGDIYRAYGEKDFQLYMQVFNEEERLKHNFQDTLKMNSKFDYYTQS